ncbi:MAG: MOSC domain-containing protein [Chloroflexi bacterium]|jgi:MOSC domain-containing protein YiiM|nr:MOSC domain-containing protein [Chloroflexota bacterium]MBT4072579.1 MOSC domain-containing protein [Chloroflexota bacterium]MBT4515676.1 MOSC domain-containing protein [Chloroflexota bacterium]MBT6681312.1 MOSC domain-containing protein [Chloroflexota bacterium]
MSDSSTGKIVDIRLNVARRQPMSVVESAEVKEGEGLVGDRHAEAGSTRQILMMDKAVMDTLEVDAGQLRENITVEGVSLFGLKEGQTLKVGDGLEFKIGELCDPCDNMDHIRPGLREKIDGQRGLFVTPLGSGTVSLGDDVTVG